MIVKKYRRPFFWLIIGALLIFGADQSSFLSQEILLGQTASNLVINEFVAQNNTGLTDAVGDHAEWIEIYNPGRRPVNLSGWALTDEATQPNQWTFPDIVLGGDEYLVVFASGHDRNSGATRKPPNPSAELHANFRLKQNGEFLGLYNILAGQFGDQVKPQFPPQFADMSYGRYGDGGNEWGYLKTPTPGQPNNQSQFWAGVVVGVDFNPTRGFYEAPFNLELKTSTPGAVIRYTTDGSEPTETNGLVYSGPISINRTTLVRAAAYKPNFLPSPAVTQSYIFLKNVLSQSPHPAGFPPTWGFYSKNYDVYKKGEPVQADYEMDPEIVNDARYGPLLKNALQSIPSISLVTAMDNFDIYGAPRERGLAWERPVSVELIDPTHSGHDFQINAGLRIQGQTNRWEFMPKHSFRLFFRATTYGVGKLDFSLFPDSTVTKFNTLILRGGSGESFAAYPGFKADYRTTTYARDEWLRESQMAMSGIGVHGIFVHLYLNGLYWGLYNLVEHPDAAFMTSYFGDQKQDWSVVNFDSVVDGSSDRFDQLKQLVQEGGLARPEKYAQLQSYLDTTEFCDYLILNWYAGNVDWLEKNWFAVWKKSDGRIRYVIWDGEGTWAEPARIFWEKPAPSNVVHPLFEALIQNPDFRMELADRMYKHLFNAGELTDAKVQARWLKITTMIEPAMAGKSARWGDTRYASPITPDDWLKARQAILDKMTGNAARLVVLTRKEGYYPEFDPPEFNQPGGQVMPGFALTMTAPNGMIYYTTDGADPRLQVTGAVAPSALVYSDPVVLTRTTRVKARVLAADQTWSALHEAIFSVGAQGNGLRITEIMYHPRGSDDRDGDDYEFIELKNTGDTDAPLANLHFEGLKFTFPPGSAPLAPGKFVVLARDAKDFAERYPGVELAGVYSGKLSNKSERITLKDPQGGMVVSIEYDDENGWPISPDGQGDSLVIIDPAGDPNNPKNWRASANINGSPGQDDPLPH